MSSVVAKHQIYSLLANDRSVWKAKAIKNRTDLKIMMLICVSALQNASSGPLALIRSVHCALAGQANHKGAPLRLSHPVQPVASTVNLISHAGCFRCGSDVPLDRRMRIDPMLQSYPSTWPALGNLNADIKVGRKWLLLAVITFHNGTLGVQRVTGVKATSAEIDPL